MARPGNRAFYLTRGVGMTCCAMKKIYLISALVVVPGLAQADAFCADLWFSRNAIMDAAGHCFTSPLGKAYFDNSDCLAGGAQVSPEAFARISRIKAREAEFNCAIDTSAEDLATSLAPMRRSVTRVPVRDLSESSCIGYQGTGVTLYADASETSKPLGEFGAGDNILSSHEFEIGADGREWGYVTVETPRTHVTRTSGWTAAPFFETCDVVAG